MQVPQLPTLLLSRTIRVFRPKDLASVYINPSAEIGRLVEQGAVARIAHGYYVLVPPQWVGTDAWRPDLEAVALGIAAADYGTHAVALMGPSAARLLGAIPRAIAGASVLAPKQRPPLATRWGTVVFHERDPQRLDLQRVDTDLAPGYQTTIEQTALDLARWGDVWKISSTLVVEAILDLAGRADWSLLRDLAVEQGERAAFIRARWLAHETVPDAPRLTTRGRVRSLGLEPPGHVDRASFRIEE